MTYECKEFKTSNGDKYIKISSIFLLNYSRDIRLNARFENGIDITDLDFTEEQIIDVIKEIMKQLNISDIHNGKQI